MTTAMREATSSAVEKAGEAVQAAGARAGEGAGGALGSARARARDEVDRRTTQAGERALGTAADIRSVSDELRRQGKDGPARAAERAAEEAERVGSYLRDADPSALLGDVERFGRRRPWAVAVAGMALGLVAARALKASSADRYAAGAGVAAGRGPDAVGRPAGAGPAEAAGAVRPAGAGGR